MAEVTIWYDGGCPLCMREIALMKRLDRRGKIQFIDLEDPAVVCPTDRDAMLVRIHAESNGELLTGMAAFAAMWRAIPVMRPLGLLARNQTILSLLEWFYVRFLKVRPHLQSWLRKRAMR